MYFLTTKGQDQVLTSGDLKQQDRKDQLITKEGQYAYQSVDAIQSIKNQSIDAS